MAGFGPLTNTHSSTTTKRANNTSALECFRNWRKRAAEACVGSAHKAHAHAKLPRGAHRHLTHGTQTSALREATSHSHCRCGTTSTGVKRCNGLHWTRYFRPCKAGAVWDRRCINPQMRLQLQASWLWRPDRKCHHRAQWYCGPNPQGVTAPLGSQSRHSES